MTIPLSSLITDLIEAHAEVREHFLTHEHSYRTHRCEERLTDAKRRIDAYVRQSLKPRCEDDQ